MTQNPAGAPGTDAQFVGRFRWTRDSATLVAPVSDPTPPTETAQQRFDEAVAAHWNQKPKTKEERI